MVTGPDTETLRDPRHADEGPVDYEVDAFHAPRSIAPTAPGPRYEGRGVLGEGGMGEVRLYFDHEMGREVAMKVLLPRHADSRELRARFEREALVQGQLDHPAVVPVYEKGTTSAGLPWFTMKRVRGETLDTILDRLRAGDERTQRQFPRHRLLRDFAHACRAVDFAHSRGVVHCDLKPSNLMLGDFGEVYVLDWGLAQGVGGSAEHDVLLPDLPNLSGAGRLLGTPGFAAPERAREGAVAKPSADAYSLGAILFELLTLERLVEPGTAEEQLRQARDGTRARARLGERRETIPADLADICAEAVRRTVKARPSAAALADAVEVYLAGEERSVERRQRAQDHLERARRAAEGARRGPDPAGTQHRTAIHECIRALRLDANNIGAAETLAQLMIDPPKTLPYQARKSMEAETTGWLRDSLRTGALGRLSWLLYVPVVLWAGLRSAELLALLLAVAGVGGLAQYMAYRRPTRTLTDMGTVLVVLTIAPTCLFLGPLWLTPLVVLASVPALIAAADPRRTRLVVAAGALTIALPTLFEWAGRLPDMYRFAEGEMIVRSPIMQLDSTTTHVLILVMSLGALVTSALLVSRARELFMRSVRRHHMELWQLAQLIPGIRAGDIGKGKRRGAK